MLAATSGAATRADDGAQGGPVRRELPDGLTQREAEILGMIACGMTNSEIAAALVLSGHTVKTHINRIFAKTGSRDRMAVARYAREHNLDST